MVRARRSTGRRFSTECGLHISVLHLFNLLTHPVLSHHPLQYLLSLFPLPPLSRHHSPPWSYLFHPHHLILLRFPRGLHSPMMTMSRLQKALSVAGPAGERQCIVPYSDAALLLTRPPAPAPAPSPLLLTSRSPILHQLQFP